VSRPFTYYEFFAGGGMARAGLGAGWTCLFANDFDRVKAETYRANWGGDHFREANVFRLSAADLPGVADLAWASSPCQDLSLAGKRAGLGGGRSSAFWGFWRLMQGLNREGRAPRTIVIENVVGLLTSHGGADFTALCQALAEEGYRFGAVEIDAALFLPQSRPRLFVIATRADAPCEHPKAPFHTGRIEAAYARLPQALKAGWVWWALPAPPARNADLMSVLEPDAAWHGEDQSAQLLALLSPAHQARMEAARAKGLAVGALYRRIREEAGVRVQRGEVRFDGLAGCLRTPGGGSSRQFLVLAEPDRVRTRALSPREGARLMGLPDGYRLPDRTTHALHVVGDGVAVPAVRWLAAHAIEPMLSSKDRAGAKAMMAAE
jgi:DNA (cytosine-5)-methyltransferase 1